MATGEKPDERPETVAPQPITSAQTVILTVKLLVGAGVGIALLWVIDRAVS